MNCKFRAMSSGTAGPPFLENIVDLAANLGDAHHRWVWHATIHVAVGIGAGRPDG
jgi:hypothetical protein